MEKLLSDETFRFVSREDKAFIVAFDSAMQSAGYANNGIQPYVVFGKYKIEYYKPGNKTKKYVARVYIREDEIVLRLYCSNIDRYSAYLENAPDYIKKPFVDDSHKCKGPNCKGMGNDKASCRYRKLYAIGGVKHIKCAEQSFCYYGMDADRAQDYVKLLTVFYPKKKSAV